MLSTSDLMLLSTFANGLLFKLDIALSFRYALRCFIKKNSLNIILHVRLSKALTHGAWFHEGVRCMMDDMKDTKEQLLYLVRL